MKFEHTIAAAALVSTASATFNLGGVLVHGHGHKDLFKCKTYFKKWCPQTTRVTSKHCDKWGCHTKTHDTGYTICPTTSDGVVTTTTVYCPLTTTVTVVESTDDQGSVTTSTCWWWEGGHTTDVETTKNTPPPTTQPGPGTTEEVPPPAETTDCTTEDLSLIHI